MMLIISITYILFVTTAGKKWGKGEGEQIISSLVVYMFHAHSWIV